MNPLADVVGLLPTALLFLVAGSTVYLWTIAMGSLRPLRLPPEPAERLRFAVLIAAHNEAATIGATLAAWCQHDYSPDEYRLYVVADHCQDGTATVARAGGATVFERFEAPAGSKGAALVWLWQQIRSTEAFDAVAIFDADTRVATDFLKAMNHRLLAGEQVVQGQHRIANGHEGAYPALADAMMRVDNRFGNLGRSQLGLSAKHMGDSIAFRAALFDRYAEQSGLTEDYALRLKLLLDDVRIAYAPEAVGYGEAPPTWRAAQLQRLRWLSGTYQASHRHVRELLRALWRRRSARILDSLLQAVTPAFSTLVCLSVAGLITQILLPGTALSVQVASWLTALLALCAYPVLALALDRAPARLYLALLWGPWFAVWRVVLALGARLPGRKVAWVRTPRRAERRAPTEPAGQPGPASAEATRHREARRP